MDPRTSRAGSLRLLERGKPLKFLRLPAAVTMIAAILFTLGDKADGLRGSRVNCKHNGRGRRDEEGS